MKELGYYDSPLGRITIASENGTITGLWFDGQKYDRAGLQEYTEYDSDVILETKKWLDVYFSGNNPGKIPPVSFEGTAFQKEVWKLLCAIPYGSLMTYGEIAEKLGRKKAAQAVGNAVGHNPVSILIPCHRVIGSDGSLTGYAGGTDRKRELLALEKSTKMCNV